VVVVWDVGVEVGGWGVGGKKINLTMELQAAGRAIRPWERLI